MVLKSSCWNWTAAEFPREHAAKPLEGSVSCVSNTNVDNWREVPNRSCGILDVHFLLNYLRYSVMQLKAKLILFWKFYILYKETPTIF